MSGRARAAAAGLLLGLLAACDRHPVPPPAPHYVVGGGYQLGGTWYYPRESFQYAATGLAETLATRPGALTANGERYDPQAMLAAHQTLQLPAIVRVTNLETGLETRVRVNDRGPASPARLIGLSPRAAGLLGIRPGEAAQVRVEVEEGPSLALREQLRGGPHLDLATAPRAAVTQESLAPPPGIARSARFAAPAPGPAAATAPPAAAAAAPGPLPATAQPVAARPGRLMIRAGAFDTQAYARALQASLAGLGASLRTVREGRTSRTEVWAGPFGGVAAADAALERALQAGAVDARIVVE